MNSAGFIIAIDGPDGSGKTTQLTLLKEWLEKQNLKVHATRASGGTPIGEELRKASLSNTERSAEVDLYISLAMHTAVGQDIQKRKAAGEIILVDRSPLAIIAYQNFGSQLKDQQAGYDACEKMLKLWGIDLLLVFSISEDELAKRNKVRKQTHHSETTNYYEQRDSQYKQRVREGYKDGLQFAKSHSVNSEQVIEVDANKPVNDLQEDLREKIAQRLL